MSDFYGCGQDEIISRQRLRALQIAARLEAHCRPRMQLHRGYQNLVGQLRENRLGLNATRVVQLRESHLGLNATQVVKQGTCAIVTVTVIVAATLTTTVTAMGRETISNLCGTDVPLCLHSAGLVLTSDLGRGQTLVEDMLTETTEAFLHVPLTTGTPVSVTAVRMEAREGHLLGVRLLGLVQRRISAPLPRVRRPRGLHRHAGVVTTLRH